MNPDPLDPTLLYRCHMARREAAFAAHKLRRAKQITVLLILTFGAVCFIGGLMRGAL